MRGGAIPFVVWATLNLVLATINILWERPQLDVELPWFTVFVIYNGAFLLFLAHRRAVSRGPPEYVPRADVLPRLSYGAAGVGLGCGLGLFGVVFGKWLIYMGGGLVVLSVLRLVLELLSQRRTLESVGEERRP